jgi:hypothetical protein
MSLTNEQQEIIDYIRYKKEDACDSLTLVNAVAGS